MRALTIEELRHGSKEAPAEPRILCAGELTTILDGMDLRYLRVRDTEIVRRIYVAARDQNWGTIPARYRIGHIEEGLDGFEIEIKAEHQEGDLDFAWQGRITGSAEGRITYRMDGVCGANFRYNRIGLCALLPLECAGRPYAATTPDGTLSGDLPDLIGPQRFEGGHLQPLFPPFSSLTIDEGDTEVTLHFQGDLFEMEDQRNWTDASFKIYSTPLSLGFPHTARAGQRISQRVDVVVTGKPRKREAGGLRLIIDSSREHPLPSLGFGMSTPVEPYTPRETELLRQLRPDHLRVDLHMHRDYTADLTRAIEAATTVGCGLEVALFLSQEDSEALDELTVCVRQAPVARFLVFDARARSSEPTETTSASLIQLARRHLQSAAPQARFVGGTDMSFCELNRTRPPLQAVDAVSYSINPQVHAFDGMSLMETVQAQAETVKTARSFCGDLPVVVSPITLKPRYNPNAIEAAAEGPLSGYLPTWVDVRQMSLFTAAWTVGSIKYLAESGAASLTYYEATGWRGLMERESGSPLPGLFPSAPGMVFPVYHVFADVAEWKGGTVVECTSSRPLAAVALGLRRTEGLHLLVANLSGSLEEVVIGPVGAETAAVRILDEGTVRTAMLEPERFRATPKVEPIQKGEVAVRLAPYAVARLDLPG